MKKNHPEECQCNYPPMTIPPNVYRAIKIIHRNGVRPYIIGGAVRDHIYNHVWKTNIEIKDWDVEVFGWTKEELDKALHIIFGNHSEDGKAFSVFRVTTVSPKIDIEFSLPRKETKVGQGHRAFEISTDSDMSLKEAARRRDFTMNAIFYDPIGEKYYDPFYGITDIKCRKLKIVDVDTFGEDPLRYYRAAQFLARFRLSTCCITQKKLLEMAKDEGGELIALPKERITEELRKVFIKGVRPSLALNYLDSDPIFGKLLTPLKNIKQDSIWHPEGNVCTHTRQAMEFVHDLTKGDEFSDDDRVVLGIAAMFHDVGKVNTTIRGDDGRIRSPGHALAGSTMVDKWLREHTNLTTRDQTRIVVLIRHHMTIAQLYQNHLDGIDTNKSLRRLALKLNDKGASLQDLEILWLADRLGRHDPEKKIKQAYEEFGTNNIDNRREWLMRHRNYKVPPKPILMGRHLKKMWPERDDGVWMGAVLDTVFAEQLNNDGYTLLDGLYLARTIIENTPNNVEIWKTMKDNARKMMNRALEGEEQ